MNLYSRLIQALWLWLEELQASVHLEPIPLLEEEALVLEQECQYSCIVEHQEVDIEVVYLKEAQDLLYQVSKLT